MIWFILGFVISYIIGIVVWAFLVYKFESDIYTWEGLFSAMQEHIIPFIPIINIICLLAFTVVVIFIGVVVLIYKYSGLEKFWNKVKDEEIRKN